MAEIALHAQVRLLRIRVNEVFRLRVPKRLEPEWEEGRGIQVILVQENGLGEIERLELLLVGKKSERSGCRLTLSCCT